MVQEKAGLGAAVQGFGLVFRNLRRDPSMCYRDMILECRGITRRLDLGNRRWLKDVSGREIRPSGPGVGAHRRSALSRWTG